MSSASRILEMDAPKVRVGKLRLTNVSTSKLIELILSARPRVHDRPLTIMAGHVSAINAEGDTGFVSAFNSASLSYADGIAVVVAGRLWNSDAERMATTDLAPTLMRAMQQTRCLPLKVAVVGSHAEVADAAARRLQIDLQVEITMTADGYPNDWSELFNRIRKSQPDILILGIGMPLEAIILERHALELPACVILTCGGWLRLLAGSETRSPPIMRKLRLEWFWRLCTDPRRTWKRYCLGAWHVARIALDR